MNDLTRFNHSQSQWRLQPHMKEPGCREWNLYKSIVARRLPPSRPLNPWQSSHRPCAESMSGLGCNRKEKEKKERQGWGRRKEAVNKKNKKKGWSWSWRRGWWREGEIYGGRLLLHSTAPGRWRKRGGEREAKHSLSPSSSLATQKPRRGAKSFVSAVEEAGDVGFVLKCWI